MRKIPTLFEREFDNHKVVNIKPIVTPGLEWVLNGEGIATVKFDGACCAIFDGVFYKRYDAKGGKKPPAGAIPCQPEPDPITGHWPHWKEVMGDRSEDKWFLAALDSYLDSIAYTNCAIQLNGTYEAIGKHFNGNPYKMDGDTLVKHGTVILKDFPRDFVSMREYLHNSILEGVVFWRDGEPRCKIKRSDFGFSWPVKNDQEV